MHCEQTPWPPLTVDVSTTFWWMKSFSVDRILWPIRGNSLTSLCSAFISSKLTLQPSSPLLSIRGSLPLRVRIPSLSGSKPPSRVFLWPAPVPALNMSQLAWAPKDATRAVTTARNDGFSPLQEVHKVYRSVGVQCLRRCSDITCRRFPSKVCGWSGQKWTTGVYVAHVHRSSSVRSQNDGGRVSRSVAGRGLFLVVLKSAFLTNTNTNCLCCWGRPKNHTKTQWNFWLSCVPERKCLCFKVSSIKASKRKLKINPTRPKIKRKWNQSPHCLFLFLFSEDFIDSRENLVVWANNVLYFISKPVWGENLLKTCSRSAPDRPADHVQPLTACRASAHRDHAAGCCSHTCRFKCLGETLLFFFFSPSSILWNKKKQILKELWCQLNRDQNKR